MYVLWRYFWYVLVRSVPPFYRSSAESKMPGGGYNLYFVMVLTCCMLCPCTKTFTWHKHNSDMVLDKGGGQEHLCCVLRRLQIWPWHESLLMLKSSLLPRLSCRALFMDLTSMSNLHVVSILWFYFMSFWKGIHYITSSVFNEPLFLFTSLLFTYKNDVTKGVSQWSHNTVSIFIVFIQDWLPQYYNYWVIIVSVYLSFSLKLFR